MHVYKVHLDVFEGPMDLLLYLIKELEIDIHDIPMSILTNQYMEYIQEMKELEINIASEYLVMASELLRIKSFILLPELKSLESDEEDPREALIEQLLEYQNYKTYAETLNTLKAEQDRIFTKGPQNIEFDYDREVQLQVDIKELLEAFNKLQTRIQLEKESTYIIERESMSYEEARDVISDALNERQSITFEKLFDAKRLTKYKVVTMIIVVLEMIKNSEISLRTKESTIVFERL